MNLHFMRCLKMSLFNFIMAQKLLKALDFFGEKKKKKALLSEKPKVN